MQSEYIPCCKFY